MQIHRCVTPVGEDYEGKARQSGEVCMGPGVWEGGTPFRGPYMSSEGVEHQPVTDMGSR